MKNVQCQLEGNSQNRGLNGRSMLLFTHSYQVTYSSSFNFHSKGGRHIEHGNLHIYIVDVAAVG